MRVACLGRGDHLFVRRVGLAHHQVFADGARFQPRFLQYHAVVGAQAGAGDLAHIGAIHADCAAVYIVEAHQQVDQRGFAAARGAHDGHMLAGLDGQVQSLNQLAVGHIGEAHVLHFHLTLRVLEHARVGRVGGLRGLGDQLEDARGAGQGVLQLGHYA